MDDAGRRADAGGGIAGSAIAPQQASDAMNEALRPSTLGEILDRIAQLYRRNFLLFVGVAAVPIGVMIAVAVVAAIVAVAGGLAAASTAGSSFVTGAVIIVGLLIAAPIYIGAYVYSGAGLTQAAVSAHLGESLTIRGALASVRPRFWSYLGLLFLQGLIVAFIPCVAAGVVIAVLLYLMSQAGIGTGASVALGFVIFLAVVAAVAAIVWLALSYLMGLAVNVVEKRPAWDSLRRAAQLSKGTRGRIFVMFLLLAALSLVASAIAYIPFLIVFAAIAASGQNPQTAGVAFVIAEVVNLAVNLTLQTVITPISWIGLVLFYYDQRIRKEGFDIERLMEQAGMTRPLPMTPPGAVLPLATPLPESGLISGPAAPPDTVGES